MLPRVKRTKWGFTSEEGSNFVAGGTPPLIVMIDYGFEENKDFTLTKIREGRITKLVWNLYNGGIDAITACFYDVKW